MKTAPCVGCGEPIGLTTTATAPVFEQSWVHFDWQSKYDHLPQPECTCPREWVCNGGGCMCVAGATEDGA